MRNTEFSEAYSTTSRAPNTEIELLFLKNHFRSYFFVIRLNNLNQDAKEDLGKTN